MSHLLLRIKPDTFVNEIWLCEVEHVVRYYCVLGDFFFFFGIFLLLTDVQIRKVLIRVGKSCLPHL